MGAVVDGEEDAEQLELEHGAKADERVGVEAFKRELERGFELLLGLHHRERMAGKQVLDGRGIQVPHRASREHRRLECLQ